MEKYDVKFKKKFGQNFLRDISIVERIVECANINSNSLVVEVGPGGAILTKALARVSENVLAYEIDFDLENELKKRLNGVNNVDVLFKDFLEADILSDVSKYNYDNLYFVSNVPYYITTPIILKLIKSGLKFKKIVLMVQKEVGERFSSRCGNREYGSISVLLQYYFNIKCEFVVGREEFIPVPNVDSVVISFEEKDSKQEVINFSFFEKIVKDSFQYKRKNIRNNLKSYDLEIVESVLSKYDLNLSSRAEEFEVSVFVDLANALYR